MRINADFTQAVETHPDEITWAPSPAPGVSRLMLDRIGDEVARATTIVKFDSDKYFPEHSHDGGEEFIVLEGVFSDQYGDFSSGTYVRNPIGTSHSPHTVDGCTIFVKLWQFDKNDTEQLSINTNENLNWSKGQQDGQEVLPLHEFESEIVRVEKWAKGSTIDLSAPEGGLEILVLSGAIIKDDRIFPARSWFRYPPNTNVSYETTEDTKVFIKQGHLLSALSPD